MSNKKMIYICGKMSGLSYEEMSCWRFKTYEELNNLMCMCGVDDWRVCNPASFYNYNNNAHKTEREIMWFELSMVRQSNVVIANLKGINSSIGSCLEIYEAYKNNIPVIAFGTHEEYETTHPWIKECIARHEEKMTDACGYIADFYFW